MHTLEVDGHDTEEQADEIKLWDSDDEALYFVVSWMIDPKIARCLIVFLQG